MLCPQGALPRHQVPQLRTVISQGLLLNYFSTETLRLVSSGRGRETRSREVVIEMQMTEPVAHPINSVANRKWRWGHKRKAGLQPPSGLPGSALATLHNPQATGRQVPAWLPEGGAPPRELSPCLPPSAVLPPQTPSQVWPRRWGKAQEPGKQPSAQIPRGWVRGPGGPHGGGEAGTAPKGALSLSPVTCIRPQQACLLSSLQSPTLCACPTDPAPTCSSPLSPGSRGPSQAPDQPSRPLPGSRSPLPSLPVQSGTPGHCLQPCPL